MRPMFPIGTCTKAYCTCDLPWTNALPPLSCGPRAIGRMCMGKYEKTAASAILATTRNMTLILKLCLPCRMVLPKTRCYHVFLSEARHVTIPAGALFLWGICTVHQGWMSGPRLAQPLCWEPKGRRSKEALNRKMALAALGLPSTHWASLGLPHNIQGAALVPPQAVPASRDFPCRASLVFPMNATIQSRALKDDVDPMDMWNKLQHLDLMKPMPADVVELLKNSLKEEDLAVI